MHIGDTAIRLRKVISRSVNGDIKAARGILIIPVSQPFTVS
jgi:hypothetical protein